MTHCSECFRRFRSAKAEELYRRRKAVVESLRDGTPCAHLSERPARHRAAHQHFKQHGELLAA